MLDLSQIISYSCEASCESSRCGCRKQGPACNVSNNYSLNVKKTFEDITDSDNISEKIVQPNLCFGRENESEES